MYASPSFKTKKALKEAIAAGCHVSIFQAGIGTVPENGDVSIEGPNYVPHTWYARVRVADGLVVKVLS